MRAQVLKQQDLLTKIDKKLKVNVGKRELDFRSKETWILKQLE